MSDSDNICGTCNGSGEGMYDGTTCHACKGRGTGLSESDAYERELDRADYENDMRREREMGL